MARIILSALLKPSKDGVEAWVAEFPDIKTRSWSIGEAIARLRETLRHKMRRAAPKTGCHGEPISPVPQKASGDAIAVPIEIKTEAKSRGSGSSAFGSERARQ